MKELDPISQDKKLDQVELVSEQQKKKEYKLVGSQRKIPGLILWEYNEKTKVLDRAKYKEDMLVLNTLDPEKLTGQTIKHKVDIRENCIYFQALNKKNAEKRLKKALDWKIKTLK